MIAGVPEYSLLFVPRRDGEGRLDDKPTEIFGMVEYALPECMDRFAYVVDVYPRDVLMQKQFKAYCCASRVGLNVFSEVVPVVRTVFTFSLSGSSCFCF